MSRWRLLLAFLIASPACAASAPRLVVLVVVDQMRADYMQRFDADFSPGGLRRLEREGVNFSNAAYDYGATRTGPGHALVGSGTYPSENGIVGNEWVDRASSRTVHCAELAPSADGRTALKWFKGKSLAQRIHAAYPKSRVYGVSYKARSALLLGGPGQDNAFWWDDNAHRYRAYGADPTWLSAAEATIPHPIDSGENVDASIGAMAAALIDAEHVGENPAGAPDVLAVSFSGVDYVGHRHGPDAAETRMAVVRADEQIAALLNRLSQRIPRERMLWIVTADHGVTPVPEESRKKGLDAGRVEFPWTWRHGFGLVQAVVPPFVYVNTDVARSRGMTAAQAAESLRAEVCTWPGVQYAYTLSDAQGPHAPLWLKRTIDPTRAGDLYVVLKPLYIFSAMHSGTTHGQPTPDDQRVPLLVWGDGLAARIDKTDVSPARIAPMVLQALHIDAAGLQPPLLKKS